jgi:hypothetical protein
MVESSRQFFWNMSYSGAVTAWSGELPVTRIPIPMTVASGEILCARCISKRANRAYPGKTQGGPPARHPSW